MTLHRFKTNRNGLWAQIGGPFQRAFFQLSVVGPRLDPVDVTSLLGIKPTKSHKKGDTTKSGSQFRRTGLWLLESREVRLHDKKTGRSQFEKWLAALPDSTSAWRTIHRRFTADVTLVLYTNSMNGEFLVTPEAIRQLVRRGLPLRVDSYVMPDEDDA